LGALSMTMGSALKEQSHQRKKISKLTKKVRVLISQPLVPMDEQANAVVLHKEMFQEVTSEKRDVRLVEECVDFGFTEYSRLSEGRAVSLENGFPFDVEVRWVLLPVLNQTTGKIIDKYSIHLI